MILLQRRIEPVQSDRRTGLPNGKKKGKRLPLAGVPKKPPANIRRTFVSSGLGIIFREIDAMTDDEQQATLEDESVLLAPISLRECFAKARRKREAHRKRD